MKEWIFTVFFVSIFSYIAKILLPNGKTKNYLIFILSIVAVCSLILPIQNFSKYNDVDFSIDKNNDFLISDEYVNDYKQKYYHTLANYELKKMGIQIKKINFIFNDEIHESSLKKIKIFYGDIVMNENNQHINISSITKNILSNLFNISEGAIEIYE